MKSLRTTWSQLTRPHPSILDVERQRQSQWLSTIMMFWLIFNLFTFLAQLPSFIFSPASSRLNLVGIVFTTVFYCLIPYVLNRTGRYRVAAWVITGALIVGALQIPTGGVTIVPLYIMYMPLTLLVSNILFGWRTTVVLWLLTLGYVVVFANSIIQTITIVPYSLLLFLGLYGVLIIGAFLFRGDVERARQAELKAANQALRESETLLEQRVAARTRDLSIASDIARQITTILDRDTLLNTVAERTKAAFDLYHAAVFVYYPESDELVIEAAAGDGGKTLLAQGMRVSVGTGGEMIASAGRLRQAVVVDDVTKSTQFVAHPALPDACSEATFPMVIGGRLVGVLDFQSTKLNRFTADEIPVMTTLAEQIAIAIENARLYDEQVRTAQQLREVDAVKSRFLASMSHELRTPLNAILNFTKFVSTGMLGTVNEKQVEALDKTIGSGKHLLSLINDVLDITKIESGMLNLFIEPDVSIQSELDMVAATGETLLVEKPAVKLIKDYPVNLPAIVGDKRRIRQILLNLVSNACKFTETGSVTISAHLSEGVLHFSVKDTGPGIAAEDHELIFEAFRQSTIGVMQGSGTGLGLAIARRLAEAHGGKLWLESIPGDGAHFYVDLPVASEALRSKIMLPTPTLQGAPTA